LRAVHPPSRGQRGPERSGPLSMPARSGWRLHVQHTSAPTGIFRAFSIAFPRRVLPGISSHRLSRRNEGSTSPSAELLALAFDPTPNRHEPRMARSGHLCLRHEHGPHGRCRLLAPPLEWCVQARQETREGGAIGKRRRAHRRFPGRGRKRPQSESRE
jgi:hypothetical protein